MDGDQSAAIAGSGLVAQGGTPSVSGDAPAPGLRSDAFECLESSGADGVGEGLVVALVLVGVAPGEVGNRLVEGAALAQVGGDRDRIAGAGVGPGQGPPADPGVDTEADGVIVSTSAEPFMSRSCRQ
jgi:hypothetical protein